MGYKLINIEYRILGLKFKIINVYDWNSINITTWGLKLIDPYKELPEGHVIEFNVNKNITNPLEAFHKYYGYNVKSIKLKLGYVVKCEIARLKYA